MAYSVITLIKKYNLDKEDLSLQLTFITIGNCSDN